MTRSRRPNSDKYGLHPSAQLPAATRKRKEIERPESLGSLSPLNFRPLPVVGGPTKELKSACRNLHAFVVAARAAATDGNLCRSPVHIGWVEENDFSSSALNNVPKGDKTPGKVAVDKTQLYRFRRTLKEVLRLLLMKHRQLELACEGSNQHVEEIQRLTLMLQAVSQQNLRILQTEEKDVPPLPSPHAKSSPPPIVPSSYSSIVDEEESRLSQDCPKLPKRGENHEVRGSNLLMVAGLECYNAQRQRKPREVPSLRVPHPLPLRSEAGVDVFDEIEILKNRLERLQNEVDLLSSARFSSRRSLLSSCDSFHLADTFKTIHQDECDHTSSQYLKDRKGTLNSARILPEVQITSPASDVDVFC